MIGIVKRAFRGGGPKRLDLVGQRFGMLLVVNKAPSDLKATMFDCVCDCGNKRVLIGTELKRGNHKSCGCQRTPRTTYEYRGHPLYGVWKGMMARCNGKNHKSYPIYGGAGVKVCQEWSDDFFSFYNWAINNGYKEGLELDKDIIANKKGLKPNLYSPERCQFVTCAINNGTRKTNKITYEIASKIRESSLGTGELAKTHGLHRSTILKIRKNKIWKNQ